MKKIININFQGRVLPIEETAFDLLQQYIDSLRRYFINEEGRDEIINDIEDRIAELFGDRLKHGANCITDDDVNTVIASIGRPEDLDAVNADTTSTTAGQQQEASQPKSQPATDATGRTRLYRNADDKVLGGVCSGIANYLGIDPVFMRILFVLLFGALFWVYILLWIIVPSKSIQSNITKRLYRNRDGKILGGVCGGLAVYFKVDPWIPRLIFALPFLLAVFSGGLFNHGFWNWDWPFGPRILSGSFGSTMFIAYIVLWIAVPFAKSATEKLEMRGEKVDLNSIRDTVNDDRASGKTRSQKVSSEVKEAAQQMGEKAKEMASTVADRTKSFATQAAPVIKEAGSGAGSVIGTIFKALFMFIGGMIVLALVGILASLTFGSISVFPMRHFIIGGFLENFLAWTTLILFIALPLVAIITWIIRRIMGVRTQKHYLGFVFAGLWLVGIICAILLSISVYRSYNSSAGIEDNISITQPAGGKLYITAKAGGRNYSEHKWHFPWGWDNELGIDGLITLNSVRVNIVKSKDSSFHVYRVKLSRGHSYSIAKQLADNIKFEISQADSSIILPRSFAVNEGDKYRCQEVLMIVEIPIGKRVRMDNSIHNYSWFDIDGDWRRDWSDEWNENWGNGYNWDVNRDYVMTPTGLEAIDKLDATELKKGKFKLKIDKEGVQIEANDSNNNDDKDNDGIKIKVDRNGVEIKSQDDDHKDMEQKNDKNNSPDIRIKKDSGINIRVSTVTHGEDPNSVDEEGSVQAPISPLLNLHELF